MPGVSEVSKWEDERLMDFGRSLSSLTASIPRSWCMISAISSQGSVRFMQRLIRTSEQKVFLILDNLKVHHGKLAAAWLEKNKEKIEVFFLPPYAPEYNPDEYLNHALKISVHSGQLPYTVEDISHKIQSFMRRLQHHPSAVSSFFLHPSLSYLCPQK